jgi:hypothetical protein
VIKPEEPNHPVNIEGWLDDDDPFFAIIDGIVEARFQDQPRSDTGIEELGSDFDSNVPDW